MGWLEGAGERGAFATGVLGVSRRVLPGRDGRSPGVLEAQP